MRAPYTQLYLHLVWSTWDRHPFLVGEVRDRIYECIQAECVNLRVEVIAIGGIEDHLHLLVRVPPTIAPADLVKRVKGASSHMMNPRLPRALLLQVAGRVWRLQCLQAPRPPDPGLCAAAGRASP